MMPYGKGLAVSLAIGVVANVHAEYANNSSASASASTTAQGSELGGQSVRISAGQNLSVKGSNVLADQDVSLDAGGNVSIEAAQNSSSSSTFNETKKSGLMGSGGIGITIGTQQQSLDQQGQQTTAAASTVGSTGGNVNITAGNTFTQTGSDVLTPVGNIDITAQSVNITEARETSSQSSEQRAKQSGLTLAITSPVISALQTASSQVQAAGNTSSSRMQALAGANAAMNLKQGADAIQAGQGLVKNAAGEMVEGNAADKAGGVGISLSLGSSSSHSRQNSSSDSARGSTVTAGGNISIQATGAGANSDLTIQGSRVQAGQTTRLQAQGDINLLAAANTSQEQNSQSNKSGSIGVTAQLGAGGANMGVTASASRGTGQGTGTGTTFTNTQVAGNTVSITSGQDTTLKGAVVKANEVTANVGGNLNIESQQDSNRYNERNQSAGGSVTIGPASGGSLNLSQTKINSNFQSTAEQSAIRAGDGGFAVNVQGNTALTGGQITSTQAAIDQNKNSFTTGGTLTTTDLQNQASFEAKSVSIGVGTSGGKVAPSGVGVGSDKGSASSTTTAGISAVAGNKEARTGDKETGIGQIFNKEQVQQEVAAQVTITSEFGKQASKAVGDYAGAKLREAEKNNDQAGIEAWKEGGANRVALHAVVGGLTGGVSGAAGAAAASAAAPGIEQLQGQLQASLKGAGLGDDASKVIASLAGGATAATIGAAASGGTTAGAATAFNADMNNRQLHPTEKQRIKELAKGDAQKEARLTAAACALVSCYAEYPEGSVSYNTLKAMADVGSGDAMSAERLQLKAQQGLFGYSTQGVFSDKNIDAAKQVNNTYQVTTRALGAGQAVLGGLGVAGSVATAPVSCATGVGCVANAAVATLGADTAIAGAKQAISGAAENTYLNEALQGLGLSTEAASYAEFALGVGAGAKVGNVVNAATNRATKMNELAASSYAKFNTNGVKPTADVLSISSVQALAQEMRAASPGISDLEFRDRLAQYLSSGSSIPSQATAGPGSVLLKIVPKGEEVSSYSPFWMSPQQVRSIGNMTPEQASKALGLPSDMAWKILNGGVDYYAITPKTGKTPKVFVSDIASTSQGTTSTVPAAQQVLVPNRSQWTDPKRVNPFTLR